MSSSLSSLSVAASPDDKMEDKVFKCKMKLKKVYSSFYENYLHGFEKRKTHGFERQYESLEW